MKYYFISYYYYDREKNAHNYNTTVVSVENSTYLFSDLSAHYREKHGYPVTIVFLQETTREDFEAWDKMSKEG